VIAAVSPKPSPQASPKKRHAARDRRRLAQTVTR